MLRITIAKRPADVRVVLEGRLVGPWVDELERCWQSLIATEETPICVQLDAVTFIDAAGKKLLRRMHEDGATLAASGTLTREILDEVTAGCAAGRTTPITRSSAIRRGRRQS
jgi:hypothetical protein